MPNLKYLNINGVNYSLGRDTRIHYGSTSETITDLQEGDLLIDLVGTPQAGKNLLPCLASTTTIGGITYTVNNDGTVYASGTSQGTNQTTLDYGHVILPAGTYTLTGCPEGGADSTYRICLGVNSYVGTYLEKDTGSGKTFTLTETTDVYARIYIQPAADAVNLVFSPMICFSSESSSTYEQGKGNTYAISLGNEASTVYGGTLDVVSGQLTVTHGIKLVNELSWTYADTPSRCSAHITDIKRASGARRTTLLSSEYVCVDDGRALADVPNGSIYNTGTSDWVTIVDARYTTADAFTTAQGSQQIVYPLATPQTYQLTATQVALLRGDSKIWSDSGDTSVIYTNINDTTSTASGSIANITSAKKAPAQSVVTEINCKQDLNGYDNPWAGGAGKNICNEIHHGNISGTGAYGAGDTRVTNATSATSSTIKVSAGSYTISATGLDYCTVLTKDSGGNIVDNYASSWHSLPYTFTITSDAMLYYTCRRSDNAYITIANVKIQIESGSSATTWEPYENICPITGYNNINITKINPLYDTSETGTRMYKYNGDATWTEISVSGNGGLLNLENGSATGSVRGINTSSEDGTYVMGQNAVAVGGNTQAAGANSFTSGLGTVAQRGSQAVFGEYNTLDTTGSTSTRGDYIFMLGNGTSNARSNATTIDWEGSIDTHGAITAGSIDNGYGLNDQALLASDTIALWEDIING